MLLTNKIYSIVETTIDKNTQYSLQYYQDKFLVPDKIYGKSKAYATRIWNSFVQAPASEGCMFTGSSGNSKTLTAQLLSNIALDNNIPVIYIHSIRFKIELIQFLATFNNVVIFIDEFTKLAGWDTQDFILSFMSDNNFKRLFIITENRLSSVSDYIRNRPGRIKYALEFDRVDRDTLDEYCVDHKVDLEFYNQLVDLHKQASVFSFDHLQTIVSEHLRYPNDKLEDLLHILNIKILNKNDKIIVTKVIRLSDNSLVENFNGSIKTAEYRDGNTLRVNLGNYGNIWVSKDDVVDISTDGIEYVFERDGYRVITERQ